jgi:hypothetical protein
LNRFSASSSTVGDRARDQVAAHRRDDAEAAAVVAAFGNLQIGVVLRRQLDALRRHQVDERLVRLRQVQVDRVHHFGHRVRAGHGQHLRVHLGDDVVAGRILLGAEAAGDDDLAVFGQRLADGVERFLHGGVDEAAGVDDDEVGAVIGLGGLVAFRAQLGQDLFGVDQRLRAAERNEADLGRGAASRREGRWHDAAKFGQSAIVPNSGARRQKWQRRRHATIAPAPHVTRDYFLACRSARETGSAEHAPCSGFCICSCICTNRFLLWSM